MLRIDPTSVPLAGEVIIQLARGAIDVSTGKLVNGGGDMLAEVYVTVLGVASIAFQNAAPVSYIIIEVRAGVMLGMFTASVIGVVTDIVVIVLAGVDSSICEVTIIALESMPIVASFEETLFLDW